MYKPKLSIKLILPVLLGLLVISCGNLDDFKSSEYRSAKIEPNGLAYLENGLFLPYRNLGVEALVLNIPKTKIQSNSSSIPSTGGSIKFYNFIAQTTLTSPNPALQSIQINDKNPEIFLRNQEEFLLGNPDNAKSSLSSMNTSRAKSFSIGDTWGPISVNKSIGNHDTLQVISTKCVAVTNEAYFFSEVTLQQDDAAISTYKNNFKKLYDSVHTNFGVETDSDNNGKINVVIFDMGNDSTIGYFNSGDKYPKSSVSTSNESDIIYINSRFAYNKGSYKTVLATFAHEIQHMVYFDTKRKIIDSQLASNTEYQGDAWLNEGLSMLSEHFADYNDNVDGWIKQFLNGNYINLSLTHWSSSNYGFSGLFVRYLFDKTSPDIGKSLYNTNLGGINAVERVIGKDFNTIFEEFAQTVYLSADNKTVDKNYNFTSVDFSTLNIYFLKPDINGESGLIIKPYGITFIKNDEDTEKLCLSRPLKGYLSIK